MKTALETVQKKMCDQCLFSENKIVSDKRKEQILTECKTKNRHFICHKATIAGKKATCHMFYKKCTNRQISRAFEEAGLVEFVDIE